MRNAKSEKTEIDLSKPLNLDNFKLSEKDCFGREWDPSQSECNMCADIDVCGCLYGRLALPLLQKTAKSLRKTSYLDEVNFERIDKDKLYKSIIPGKTTSSELATYVKYYSKCDDLDSIKNWIKFFKGEKKLIFKKGIIYYG